MNNSKINKENQELTTIFWNNCKDIAKKRKITFTELAKRIGIQQRVLTNMKCRNSCPHLTEVYRISKILNCPIDSFFTGILPEDIELQKEVENAANQHQKEFIISDIISMVNQADNLVKKINELNHDTVTLIKKIK